MLDIILGSRKRAVNNITSLFSWILPSSCEKKDNKLIIKRHILC